MGKVYALVAGCAMLLASVECAGQTVLAPGDIAVIAFNFDDADQVVFVPLVDLSVGTTVSFTDKGWTGTAFAGTEGTYTYTAPTGVAKGTVVTLNTSGMSLSTSGDQVFAYQGSILAPVLIYGLSSRPWVSSGSITANTSYRPGSLVEGQTCMAFGTERDNGYCNVISATGDKSALLGVISNPANWTRSDSRYGTWPSWSWTVSNLAPEPSSQATGLTFSNVATWRHEVGFTAASPSPTGYLVLRRKGGLPTGSPVDGSIYAVGDQVGDAKVAAVGAGTAFTQEGTVAGSTYGYKVFSYNGSGSMTNYRQASALGGSVTTPTTGMGSYYNGISSSNATFVSDLAARVSWPYVRVAYDTYDETQIAHFAFTDTLSGQRVARCVYSGELYVYQPPFQWYSASPFSREHTYCHSWMPSYPLTSTDEYADQHHIFTVNQSNANVVRSNHPLGAVVGAVTSTYLESSYGADANGNRVYQPRAAHRGDAARALLYMALRYHGNGGQDWTYDHLNGTVLPALGEGPQDLTTLRTWHDQDPPDAYEMARNDYIESIQGNRNPFVDHPEWVAHIDFGTLGWVSTPKVGDGSGSTMDEVYSATLGPNPTGGMTTLGVMCSHPAGARWYVADPLGRIVLQERVDLLAGETEVGIDMGMLGEGLYLVVLEVGEDWRQVFRLVKAGGD